MKKRKISIVLCAFALMMFMGTALSYAGDPLTVGRVVRTRGQVDIFTAKKDTWETASPGRTLEQGDAVRTGPDGRASILMEDESLIQVNKGSQLVFKDIAPRAGWNTIRKVSASMDKSRKSLYKAVEGDIWFRNKDRDANIYINLPTAVVGVRGTDLVMKIASDKTTTVSLLEGIAEASNEFGSVSIKAGEEAVVPPDEAPVKRILLSPVDAIQWTITAPHLIDPGTIRDIHLLKAHNDLMDGEVRRAYTALTKITQARPLDSLPWSMLALSALILGEKKEALAAAQKGVDMDPHSLSALIVLSYTYQANFEFHRALGITEKAYGLDGTDPLVLTNLARLKFGAGYTDEAMKLIETAQSFSPGSAEIYSLKGFIVLARRGAKEAIPIFRKAIDIDSAMGEPHMGLAIAMMRLGDVACALEEISTAVLLDPRRALFLSYWGKMLYQVKRHRQAIDIFQYSHKIDPYDPTPELYKSMALKDLNRPAEAITALNNAVMLNDNRAVYRSKFLLDQDLAVKNVDLSHLYGRLGLSEWARSKAMSSVKQDYNNSSAHLFLAGSIRDDGERSWMYMNETLLARMLMPANLNSFNTFNEYTPFFERPAINGSASGTLGSFNGTSGELYLYGGAPQAGLAFGAGTKYSHSNGWRRTNSEREADFAGIIKWDATSKDRFMFTGSCHNGRQADKWYPRYEYDSASDPYTYRTDRLTRLELGYNRQFTPASNLLIYLSSLTDKGKSYDNVFRRPTALIYLPKLLAVTAGRGDIDTDYQIPYKQVQAQYLARHNNHQFIIGANHYWGENTFEQLPWLDGGPIYSVAGNPLAAKNTNIMYQHSFYAQDTWKMNGLLTVEGALYYDRMKDGAGGYSYSYDPDFAVLPGLGTLLVHTPPYYRTEMKADAWSPRLGLIITPTKTDTIRIAGLQYMLPYLTSRLDPTSIAGIPVYRNAAVGSIVKEASLAWEHEWSTGLLSTNLFYLEKEYACTIIQGIDKTTARPRGYTRGFETALNQIIGRGLGLNVGYRFRDIDDEDLLRADRREHIARAGMKYLHWSGFSCGAYQTYRRDHMKTKGMANNGLWITDAYVGYEFPGKKGAVKLEGRNIFNSHFNWVTDYYALTGRVPTRELVATVTINF